jgi:hypothetical protein
MSETSILPGAAPSTDSGIDMVPPGTGFDETEGGDRRRIVILGGVVGAVVIAAAAFLFLHKGSSTDSNATFTPHSTSAPGTPTHTGGKPSVGKPSGSKGHPGNHHPGNHHPGKPATLPKKAKNATVRDPFEALVQPPVATSGNAESTTTVNAPGGGTDTTHGDGTTTTPVTQPTEPVTQPTQPTTTTTGGGKTVGAPLWIQLTKVNSDKATFKVGYAHHKFRRFVVQAPKSSAQRGTVFDKIFALIGIQNGQVTIQIGDDTPFDLTKGVSHVV